MKREFIIGGSIALIILIALYAWYFTGRGGSPGTGSTGAAVGGVAAATTTSPAPTPSLSTITAIHANTLTLKALDGAKSEVQIISATLIYENGAPISSSALKTGRMVAVILYPSSIGASEIAQTITVVSTR